MEAYDYFVLFAILLLIVGLVLLVAEVFIPSGGMILILALVCISSSVWCGWKAWWGINDNLDWWTYVGALVVAIPSAVVGILYLFPRTSMGKRILLEAPSLEEVTAYAEDYERLSRLVGRFGTTITLLNPSGLVSVDGERLHCESEGMYIDPQQDVQVVRVQGNGLIVRLAPADTDLPKPAAAGEITHEAEDDVPLDFDVPRS